MRKGIAGFQPQRLTEAREALGMTKASLANLVEVSSATVTKWESGAQSPEEEKLRVISEKLNFSSMWFTSKLPSHGSNPYFFRSMASATKTARTMAQVRLNWTAEIFTYLTQYLDWPEVNISKANTDDFLTITDSEIEEIAYSLRTQWGLGLEPIPDVILALENAGIIVARDELGYLKMDGVSHWSPIAGRPIIFIASDKANGIRNRFDVAHELGHIILHQNVTRDEQTKHYKEIERQADFFAGCFLMPSSSFSADVSWPTLDNLLSIKPRWKTSVASMVMRCYQLDLIDDEQKLRLFKNRSARHWIKQEPYDDFVELEKPRLLPRAIKLIVDNGISSKAELAHGIGLPKWRIESLCALPNGYLNDQASSNLIDLKLKVRKTTQRSTSKADIVQFDSKKKL